VSTVTLPRQYVCVTMCHCTGSIESIREASGSVTHPARLSPQCMQRPAETLHAIAETSAMAHGLSLYAVPSVTVLLQWSLAYQPRYFFPRLYLSPLQEGTRASRSQQRSWLPTTVLIIGAILQIGTDAANIVPVVRFHALRVHLTSQS